MKKFGVAIISIYFLLVDVSAQIVYTDVNPDSSFIFSGCPTYPCTVPCTVCNIPFYFDLNNDGINDFNANITEVGGSGSCMGFPSVDWNHDIYFMPEGSNAIGSQGGNFVRQFNLSDTIGPQVAWANTSNLVVQSYSHYSCSNYSGGNWINSIGFMGLKFFIGNQVHYGWVRAYADAGLSYSSPMSLIIYDYAYNSVPNQFILAGDTTAVTSLIDNYNNFQNFSLYQTDHTLFIHYNGSSFPNTSIILFNCLGQKLIETSITSTDTQINLRNCQEGIYFVAIQNNNWAETRKFFLF